MSPSRVLSIAAPIGAGLLLPAGLIPYHVLVAVAKEMQPERVTWDSQLPAVGILGIFGACLLPLGLGSAAYRLQRIRAVRGLWLAGFAALTLGVVLIGVGNTTALSAFYAVAMAEIVRGEDLLRALAGSHLTLLLGYSLVLAAATVVCLSAWVGRGEGLTARRGCLWIGLFLASTVMLVAHIHNAASVSSFFDLLAHGESIKPNVLAGSVMGTLTSTYIELVGLAGCALGCLVVALSKSRTTRETTDE